MDQQFITEHIPTAEEFIERLRPTYPDWGNANKWASDWIFRGQSNSKFTLTPSAWRRATEGEEQSEAEKVVTQKRQALEPTLKAFEEGLQRGKGEHIENRPIRDVLLQAYTEFTFVREFIDFADSLGFHTPGASEFPEGGYSFISDYFHSLSNGYDPQISSFRFQVWRNSSVALAQHHGIPTRLLDWTRRPLYAAFFAAERVDQSHNESEQIAVFAVHRDSLQSHVNLFSVPRSENPFLHAQDGVFTIDTSGDDTFQDTGTWRHLETVSGLYPESPLMHPKKIVMPVSEIGKLLRLLSLENISRAHLMPSFDNVAHALKAKWKWTSSSGL